MRLHSAWLYMCTRTKACSQLLASSGVLFFMYVTVGARTGTRGGVSTTLKSNRRLDGGGGGKCWNGAKRGQRDGL